VDECWSEIVSSLDRIEKLSDDETFQKKELAASIASKCFFHLEELNEALHLALASGDYFNVAEKSEYVSTMISKCVEEYIKKRSDLNEESKIDVRMENIVERMFEQCYVEQEFTQAIGIALESKRLDKIEQTILRANDKLSILKYTFTVSRRLVQSREFRFQVLDIIARVYQKLDEPDYLILSQCFQFLNRPKEVAKVLSDLLFDKYNSKFKVLMSYQIAFDLVESGNQKFIIETLQHLNHIVFGTSLKVVGQSINDESVSKDQMEDINNDSSNYTPQPIELDEESKKRVTQLVSILSQDFTIDLFLNFLFRQSNSDLLVMEKIKTSTENRGSILHNASIVAHGYMNCGTTVDTFLRDNLQWLGKASNWGQFSATASIGVVHKGHVKQSKKVLEPYLPQGGISANPDSEGGALYALGLIHANHGGDGENETTKYLLDSLKNFATKPTIQHGTC
jgi:26S proteasome regulatory subunit N2